ncbi:MAG: HEAT repeat domain-containing protein [Candidatus Omnitrophica bacterium]|nr:HEAT repeat domain-containing protein [Candidatus Omnitrophota bacterium]
MENSEYQLPKSNQTEEKSFFGVIIHSFFVIPAIIAVSAVILFSSINWLTREQLTAYDYLEQVRVGGMTKRWQAAFELSKILANPKLIPQEEKFQVQLKSAFENAKNDDVRVKQYLALAMAKTGNSAFLPTLSSGLNDANEDTLRTIIYALGMLKNKQAVVSLVPYLTHANSRIRSITVAALGTLQDKETIPLLKHMLQDSEPNVQWGAALALANLQDSTGKAVIKNLLSRDYLAQYKEVDSLEQTQILLEAINASAMIDDEQLKEILTLLSKNDTSMRVRSLCLTILNKTKV